jgi:hypothetical protein
MKIIQLIGKIKDEPNADKYFADAKKYLEKLMPKHQIWTPQEIVEIIVNNMEYEQLTEQQCLASCIINICDTFMNPNETIEIYALWNIVENSKGALLEHKIADALGISVTLILKSDLYGEENE